MQTNIPVVMFFVGLILIWAVAYILSGTQRLMVYGTICVVSGGVIACSQLAYRAERRRRAKKGRD